MNMWNKLFGTSRSNCLPHQNQVLESDAVQRANLSCNVCLEENKVCTCDQSFESGKRVTGVVEHHAEANNSVIQSVVNMSGMLIGNEFFMN